MLAELELTWATCSYHGFSGGGGTWCAISSAGEVLTGGTQDELDRVIRMHLGGDAVNGTDRPDLRVVDGREDAVVQRRRFEQDHPEAVILPPRAGRWRAVIRPA